jgi:hypothetical protein
MREKINLLLVFLLIIIHFILITMLFRPGELDIFTPSHSDLYRYFVISQERWGPGNWLYPRPLMLAYLKLAGLFGKPEALFFIIAAPSVIFVTLVIWTVKKIGLIEYRLVPIFTFSFVVFGSPLFYPHFQYDYGGMLGGIFATMAVVSGWISINNKSKQSEFWWFSPVFLTMLSVESKPNYSFLLLFLALISTVITKSSRSKWLATGVASVLIWVFLKDKIIGSPFVSFNGADSPYSVIINPWLNIQALWFYVKNSFTLPLLFSILAAGATLILAGRIKLLFILLALSVVASMSMALIPNRLWDTYAWYSTVVLGVLVMIASSQVMNDIKQNISLANKLRSIMMLLVIMLGLFAHALIRHPAIEWAITNQHYNANIQSDLKKIKADGKDKILLAGIQGPYHPLKNTKYIHSVYPGLSNFDVLLRRSEAAWNQMSHEQSNGIYLSEARIYDYSKIYLFGSDGRQNSVFSLDEVVKLNKMELHLILLCGRYNFNDPTNYAKAIECLNDNEEYENSIKLGREAVNFGDIQPWIYFHLAKAYMATGDNQNSIKLLIQALTKDSDNEIFKKTLSEASK